MRILHFSFVLVFFMASNCYSVSSDILKYDQCKMKDIDTYTSEKCDMLVGKTLYGHNTRIDFSWEKGEVLGLIYKKKGALLSLLDNPDLSYIATYTGLHVIYKEKGSKEIFLTSVSGDSIIKHVYK